ncbi:helix-turn-helix domain-containing protein [Streptomyces sp. NPDC053542]|uniref:helix-turn-helix domain-containing protein n=1 Tax=Streptomyces sp. NPDC053542 TaxID=3365710 RepID=UPI0037CF0F7A
MSGAPPPETVESARLTEGLRELRARTGLSLAALAARTPYSKSSWQRYLNGTKLPPRDAVEALCRLARQRPGRLLALWELAEHAWSGRAAAGPAPGAAPPPEAPTPALEAPTPLLEASARPPGRGPAPGPRGPRTLLGTAVAAVVALAVAGAVALLAAPGHGAGSARAAAGPATAAGPVSVPAPPAVGCRGASCGGGDPEAMRCGGAGRLVTPLERTVAGGARLQVRYSTVCRAAWGRVTHGTVGDRVVLTVPGQRPRAVRVADAYDAEGYLVTPMSAAKGTGGITLCLEPADGGRRQCFRMPK